MIRWMLGTGGRAAGAMLAITLAGCGSGSDTTKVGTTAQENQALDDAAAMLDDNGQDAVIVTNETAPDNAQ